MLTLETREPSLGLPQIGRQSTGPQRGLGPRSADPRRDSAASGPGGWGALIHPG